MVRNRGLRLKLLTVVGLVALSSALPRIGAGPVAAQGVPSAETTEILVKRTLLTFNDANRTGEYSVLHASGSETLRRQLTPEALKQSFKSFFDQGVDIASIVRLPIVLAQPAAIDKDGVLNVNGHFDARPNKVAFQLRFTPAEGDWRWIGLTVDVVPSEAAAARAKPKQ